MEFKSWGTNYKQCRYQGLTDTEVSNFINDLHKMVPDAQNNMLIGIKPRTNKESGQPKLWLAYGSATSPICPQELGYWML